MTFRIAISGLKAAQTDLNVIGNNIANAGTNGFKKSRAEFQDLYAATAAGVASNTTGQGVSTAAITQNFSQGNISFTDRGLDLAISGNGFFIVEDNGTQVYSRAGAFSVDRDGFVVNNNNQRLTVFGADANGNILGSTQPFQINTANSPPSASTEVDFGINLGAEEGTPTTAVFDRNDPTSWNHTSSTTVYDSLGASHLLQSYYVKTGANTWDVRSFIGTTQVDGPTALVFDNQGALTTPATGQITTTPFTPTGAAAMTLTLDFSTATQYDASSSNLAVTQNGYPSGQLAGLEVDSEGIIFSRFTNGQSIVQGQIALANFTNPGGLAPQGQNNWAASFASGEPLISEPGSGSLGLIQAGALEESNVDPSGELVDLIVAQRNFQANTEVISTADSVTQSVINIR